MRRIAEISNELEGYIRLDKIDRESFNVLNKSKIYKGRGESKYNNIYLDVENK